MDNVCVFVCACVRTGVWAYVVGHDMFHITEAYYSRSRITLFCVLWTESVYARCHHSSGVCLNRNNEKQKVNVSAILVTGLL